MDSLVSRRCLHHGEEVSPYHLAGMQWPGSAALPAGHPRRGSRSRGGSRRASWTDLSMTSLEPSPVKWLMAANVFPQVKSETLFPCPLESPPPLPGVGKYASVSSLRWRWFRGWIPSLPTDHRKLDLSSLFWQQVPVGVLSNCFTTMARMKGLVPRVKWPFRCLAG